MDICVSQYQLLFEKGDFKTQILKISEPYDAEFPYYFCRKSNAAVISASVIGGACGITIIGESYTMSHRLWVIVVRPRRHIDEWTCV